MESYLIELWSQDALLAKFIGHPDDLAAHEDHRISAWYKELLSTRQWKGFCENFDASRFRSGALAFNRYTIRISTRKNNDDV